MTNKILFFIPDFSMGGAENMMIKLANYCFEKKISVAFIVLKSSGPLLQRLNKEIEVYSLNTDRMFWGVIKLFIFVARNRPKILLATLIQANLAAVITKLLYLGKIHVIIRVESYMSSLLMDKKNFSSSLIIIKSIFPFLYKKADKIVAVSYSVANNLKNHYGIKNSIVIPNPAITSDFEDNKSEEIVETWWPYKSKVILSIGRLNEAKDYHVLIKAFRKIKTQNVKLVILGEGELRKSLTELINVLNLGDQVMLPGFVENPLKFINHCDLFVLPSKYEGFSNALVEAIACKKPIIASNSPGGNTETLNNGTYGDLFPVGDIDCLSNLLIKNLSMKNIKEIPNYWISKFHYEVVFNKYIMLFKSFGLEL